MFLYLKAKVCEGGRKKLRCLNKMIEKKGWEFTGM
jgi:hypothetical protein